MEKLPTDAEIEAVYEPVIQYLDLARNIVRACSRFNYEASQGNYPSGDELGEVQIKVEELKSSAIHLKEPFQKLDDLKSLATGASCPEGIYDSDTWAVEIVLIVGVNVAYYALKSKDYVIYKTTGITYLCGEPTDDESPFPHPYDVEHELKQSRDVLLVQKGKLIDYLYRCRLNPLGLSRKRKREPEPKKDHNTLIINYLCSWHNYGTDGFRYEAVGVREFSEWIRKQSKGQHVFDRNKISRFFRYVFTPKDVLDRSRKGDVRAVGHGYYKTCCDIQSLSPRLQVLKRELSRETAIDWINENTNDGNRSLPD